MATTFWDEIKEALNTGATIIADKSEEYLTYTRIKKDIFTLKHQQRKLFTELGQKTYKELTKKEDANVASNKQIDELIKRLTIVQSELKKQEKQLKQLKKESSEKKKKSPTVSEKKVTKKSKVKTSQKTKQTSPKTKTSSKGKFS